MLLAIDTGNTQTVIGLFDGTELADHWRIATVASRTSDELALMIQQFLGFHGFSFDDQVTGVAVCSGVPSVTAALRAMTTRYFGFEALVLEPGVRTGMPILYDNPKEVGPDRIADAVGAYELYGGPTIVVDFGTANTVEAIQSGVIYGFSGQIDAIVDRFVAEIGPCTVVATGGLAELIMPFSRTIQHHEPWLTLHGLRIIFERNLPT